MITLPQPDPFFDPDELPSPGELKKAHPLSPAALNFIAESRKTAKEILLRRDKRRVVVVGPCSIHNPAEALEYASRLKRLADKLQEHCFLVMRVYFEKARSSGGWKGFLYDPDLNGSDDLAKGVGLSRSLLCSLAEMGVPAATEFLDPLASCYLEEGITWGFIGARTSSSQIHRQLASSLQMPIGFKNGVHGYLEGAMNGVASAQTPHNFFTINEEGRIKHEQSEGNLYTHIVLRGSTEAPNYDPHSVQMALDKLRSLGLPQRLMIDCSHGNSRKNHENQKECFDSVRDQIAQGNEGIIGIMLESYLKAGNQSLSKVSPSLQHGISVTDSCVDWSTTEELLSSLSCVLC